MDTEAEGSFFLLPKTLYERDQLVVGGALEGGMESLRDSRRSLLRESIRAECTKRREYVGRSFEGLLII